MEVTFLIRTIYNYNMAQPPKKDKLTATILAFALGFLGIHRFYLTQNSMGIGYILGSLTIIGIFVTAIIAFVDFVGLLVMSEEDFNRRYNPHLFINNSYGKLDQ